MRKFHYTYGGAWDDHRGYAHVTCHGCYTPDFHDSRYVGLRLVRTK